MSFCYSNKQITKTYTTSYKTTQPAYLFKDQALKKKKNATHRLRHSPTAPRAWHEIPRVAGALRGRQIEAHGSGAQTTVDKRELKMDNPLNTQVKPG